MVAATPAIAALVEAGVDHAIHEYEHDPSVVMFGAEAAALMEVEADRVFKTLIATTGDELVVGVVPVTTSLDLKALASEIGTKRVDMADPAAAERSSGYVVGAISPVGQKRTLTTVIDETAFVWDTIFCSGGRRGLEVELAPADLARVTGARVAAIATWA